MSLLETCVTEGNETGDEVEKDGAMLDGGEMAQIRASAVQRKSEEVHAAPQYASWLSLPGGEVSSR